MPKKYTFLIALLYAFLAIALLAPLASNEELPLGQDFQNHTGAIAQAGMALKEGQFPIRVAPWEYQGKRYPEFQFYSPLPYTIAGFLYNTLSPKNPYQAFKLMLWLALTLGGYSMYRLTRNITSHETGAILAGFAYMAAPYFLININARGALSEAFAQGIIPIVLYFTYRLYQTTRLKYICLSAIAWSALALTHIISFMNASIFIGLFFFFIALKNSPTKIFWLASAYGLSCLLSLWYFAPIALVSPLLNITTNFSFPSSTNFLTGLPTLLAFTPAGPNQPGANANLFTLPFYPAIGLPMLLAVGISFCITYTKLITIDPALQKIVKILFWLFCFALFLTWSPFNFWKFLPHIFSVTQFSYRFLSQIMWIGAILFAISIHAVIPAKAGTHVEMDSRFCGNDSASIIVGLGLIAIASAGWLNANYAHAQFAKEIQDKPTVGYANKDYLFQSTPVTNDENNSAIQTCRMKKDIVTCDVTSTHPQTITLPVLYYPALLKIKVDNINAKYQLNNHSSLPLVTTTVPAGSHNVTAQFTGLRWANWVSGFFGLIILAILFCGTLRHEQNQ